MSRGGGASPFSPRAVLALVLAGGAVFLALLWLIGAGMGDDTPNNGGAHVGGKGLNGYAAMADFLERRGFEISRARSQPALRQEGLLILTPPHHADGKEIAKIVESRQYIGPTMVVTPKWQSVPVSQHDAKGKQGWVQIVSTETPSWDGFLDSVTVDIAPMRAGGKVAAWRGAGENGALPGAEHVLSGKRGPLVPLVVGQQDARVLAAYIQDGGSYPALQDLAEGYVPELDEDETDEGRYPLIVVFEPDLVNNYGFADIESARLSERLVRAALDGSSNQVGFDLTLNGFSRSDNLLTLAFSPPFVAATLCLLLAAAVAAWRAFNRFGPALAGGRAIAFGKRALVANAAGLVRRSGRLHLIGVPYADAMRERLSRELALPAKLNTAAAEAAIDRALASRAPDAVPFSVAAARLRAARRPHEMLRSARALHSLERILTR